MRPEDLSRRDFISHSGHAAAGAWLLRAVPFLAVTQACAVDAERDGDAFITFTEREAADFDAFAGRMVPTDDTPGAREAGVTRFADQALGTFFDDLLPIVRGGLEDLGARASGQAFADLSEAEQDAIIGAVETENPGFFFFGRTLVVLGMVADAKYGGNRDNIGWDLVGFESDFVYQPPFGYYDRDEHGDAASAGAEE